MSPTLRLTVRVNPAASEARRGIVRVHPEVLAALSLREWDAVSLTGSRVTAAVVAAGTGVATGTILVDDLTLSNLGLRENAAVVITPVSVAGATTVTVTGSALAMASVDEQTLRRALLGKVLSPGDAVSLLPRDLGPELTASAAVRRLALSVGITWTNELLTVTATAPAAPVSVQTNTAVLWATAGTGPSPSPTATGAAAPATATGPATRNATVRSVPAPSATADADALIPGTVDRPIRPVSELVGVDEQVGRLTEWLRVTLDTPEVLATLGAQPRLGVIVSGPTGAGKATLVRSVCEGRRFAEIDGPSTGALESGARREAVAEVVNQLRTGDGTAVLLIADVEALLPAEPQPVSTLILDTLREAIADGRVALVVTSSAPGAIDPRLRDPELCDRELVIGLPDAATRAKLLGAILHGVPVGDGLDLTEIASRTPGFVAADLAALTRDAALRAAARISEPDAVQDDPTQDDRVEDVEDDDAARPELRQEDLVAALSVIRPASRLESPEVALGSLTLDEVGDMVETKQALTEAVLWPLQHPDTFTRLGVAPPRGVLLYGPPGCGKTFVVRALAASGRLSVHTVKGAELLDKWVGSSERAVRDLFARARQSAPSLIFLDEVDALAPRRGGSQDSGVSDKVVAALLTELDGVEPLTDVVVLGATNRPDLIDPALLRPGRLERLVFVPPPDAEARADILRASGRYVPLADDIDLDELAVGLDGYSAADCSALLREAALSAMRRDIDAATVTAEDLDVALDNVRPSLDPVQVAELQAYADRRTER